MTVSYRKLWDILDERGMKKTDLVTSSGITTNAMARMGKGEEVRIGVLLRISNALGCGLDEIVEDEESFAGKC